MDRWKVFGCKFVPSPITWGQFKHFVSVLENAFGDDYGFAPLHRSEGGINCLWSPDHVSTEPANGPSSAGDSVRKAVRFSFRFWPSNECYFTEDLPNDYVIEPHQCRQMQIIGEGENSKPWTKDEMIVFGA